MATNKKITNALSEYLADTYMLYLKTQNYHWNVTGPQFHSLHKMFEEQYTELAIAVDQIAERIRALGEKAPGSFSAFLKLSQLKEADQNADSTMMLNQLFKDHQTMAKTAHEIFEHHGQDCDEATLDLLTQRTNSHQKAAWMFRATLGD